MSLVDILLRVVPTADDELERLVLAVDLARRLGARLNGCFLAARDDGKADWAQTLFERSVGRSPIETTWRVVDGQSNAGLLFHARRSDLSILPNWQTSDMHARCTPDFVTLASGRPTLILPAPTAAMSIGHTILVGWSDTRESARAIHDAMPIMVGADQVLVFTVVQEDNPEPMADSRLADHLRQHGVRAEIVHSRGDPAETIAAQVRQLKPDMLVIGLHEDAEASPIPRLGEVSRRFIHSLSLPVLCSH